VSGPRAGQPRQQVRQAPPEDQQPAVRMVHSSVSAVWTSCSPSRRRLRRTCSNLWWRVPTEGAERVIRALIGRTKRLTGLFSDVAASELQPRAICLTRQRGWSQLRGALICRFVSFRFHFRYYFLAVA